MAINTTWSFSVQSECNDDWILASNRFTDHEAQNPDNANGGYWCWTDTGSPSTGTGPPTGVPCIYTESSSPSAVGDEFTCELRTAISAAAMAITVEFNLSDYGNASGMIYFEAYNGSSWDVIDSWSGQATTERFVAQGPYDLSSYTNADFKVRLRVVTGGTSYQNDFAWDEVHIIGVDRASIDQEGFRFYEDGAESGSTPLEAQDTDINISRETTFGVRILLDADGDPPSAQYQLEYKESGDGSAEWRKVPTS